ncbi:oxidoreductase-like domain-containing protein [Pseudoalteromonas sp. MBR-15]
MCQDRHLNEPKPQKPAPDECCGGGSCCPCVWDEYREKLRQWQLKNESKQNN